MPQQKDNQAETGQEKAAGAEGTEQARAGEQAGKGSQAGQQAQQAQQAQQGAIDLLKADHRKVEQLFQQYEKARQSAQKARLVEEVCRELTIHAMLEEEIFYPACREKAEAEDEVDEAQVEHDTVKLLIMELQQGSPKDDFYDAKVKVLSEYVKHHVNEEESKGDSLFAKAKQAGLDEEELSRRLRTRKDELVKQAQARGLGRPQPTTFDRGAMDMVRGRDMEDSMADRYRDDDRGDRGYSGRSRYDDDNRGGRGNGGQGRDDQGRFMSDDDRGRGGGGGGGRSRYDDDDRGGRGGNDRDRDDRGRFMSDDDRGRGGGGGGGGGGNRGGGGNDGRGWFGDPEGHSRASREGWRNSDHEGSGWYGDPRGHSEASRRGWENSDHEGSGWYGDRRGHSEASRRGWENSDHEGSGWYGDPRGHSEASRRGWETRREEGRGSGRGGGGRDDDRGRGR